MFVKAKLVQRAEARRLRSELGWSLARIAHELGVSKSSVSLWVRDVSTGSLPALTVDVLPTRRLPVWHSGQWRHCCRCGHDLPWECFNRLGSGLQWWCRSCFAEYFRKRGQLHREQSKAAKRARQRKLQERALRYLRAHPCVDCGENDPVVLDFDHVHDKAADVAALITAAATPAALEAEIANCEVVCANCHRRRTARRARWRRLQTSEASRRPYPSALLARNLAHLHAILTKANCADCGENDMLVLEFDHIGAKRANVTRLAWSRSSIETIDAEIRRCEVRCANCHRRATSKRGGHFRSRALTSDAPP